MKSLNYDKGINWKFKKINEILGGIVICLILIIRKFYFLWKCCFKNYFDKYFYKFIIFFYENRYILDFLLKVKVLY